MPFVVSSSVSAQSGFTPLEDAPSSEASHADILASALGGTFSASGLNFINGSITAIRNLDHDSGGEGGGSGGFFDQIWAARSYRATVIGHESDGSAHFGYVDGISGEDFTSLLNVRDIGSSASATIGDDFRWALQIGIEGIDPLFTSRESDNGVDAMVSYTLINENGNAFASVLFFEDRIIGSDWDYNDVAILLSVVPTPQAVSMGGLALLAGFGMTRRRRTRLITA